MLGLKGEFMDFKVIIGFAIGIGCYLLGLLIFVIIKAVLNKKKVKKELEEKEKQDEEITTRYY